MTQRIALPLIFIALFLTGCDTSELITTDSPSRPASEPWISVERGDPQVDPDTLQPMPIADPELIPSSEPVDSLPIASPEATEPAEKDVTDRSCIERFDYSVISPLAVTDNGNQRVTVSWDHPDDSDIIDYRIAYINQDLTPNLNTDYSWTKVEPSENCGEMDVDIAVPYSGAYIFVVDVVRKSPESSTPRTTTIARSPAVLIQ